MPVAVPLNLTEGFDEQNLKRVIPSWLISLVLHGLMFAFLMLGFHRQGLPDGDPNSREAFRDAGLVIKADFGAGDKTRLNEQQTGEATADAAVDQNATSVLIPETPQETDSAAATRPLLDLPKTSTIGATGQLPLDTPQGSGKRPPVRTAAGGGIRSLGPAGGGAGIGAPGGTSFFQIAAQGDHFCYVVDCSASMEGGAMGLARAELMASIERLDSAKRFQIFFYNALVYPMTKNGNEDLFYASEINRTFARQFINNQQPDLSTMHKPALVAALRQGPDVIFFLTDGDVPELYADDLQDLKRLNRNNTKIHVIEFGKGPKLGPSNWLEKLAKDHNGSHRYRDVDALGRG
ncbi:MAG: von Willebrand factor type [Planctomycetaceae bacterium]|nr:von Willebrand factor type [Planctomycetaceae bacterium]